MLSWINTLPEILSANHRDFIIEFFEFVVDPILEFVRKNCKVSQCMVYWYSSSWETRLRATEHHLP